MGLAIRLAGQPWWPRLLTRSAGTLPTKLPPPQPLRLQTLQPLPPPLPRLMITVPRHDWAPTAGAAAVTTWPSPPCSSLAHAVHSLRTLPEKFHYHGLVTLLRLCGRVCSVWNAHLEAKLGSHFWRQSQAVRHASRNSGLDLCAFTPLLWQAQGVRAVRCLGFGLLATETAVHSAVH